MVGAVCRVNGRLVRQDASFNGCLYQGKMNELDIQDRIMDGSTFNTTKPLFKLGAADGPPFEHYAAGRKSRYLVVCDHARNRIPECLGNMGLSAAALQEHFAWDPGSEGVGRHLADLLDCPALIGGFSRLVIDLNRGIDHPRLCTPHEDQTDIPPNIGITPDEIKARIAALYEPYHAAIRAALVDILERGEEPVLISSHSFTPQYRNGAPRPWQIGILWRRDRRVSGPVLEALQQRGDLVVGDNQPYDRRQLGQPNDCYCEDQGIRNLLFEVRHDLISTAEEQQRWAQIIFDALPGHDI